MILWYANTSENIYNSLDNEYNVVNEKLNIILCCIDKIYLAYDIAHGMEFIHSRNIIHRDLNCNNILITIDSKKID